MKTLDVFKDGQRIGLLFDSEPLSFQYADACLKGELAAPFVDLIPLSAERQSGPEIGAFFENLLPEGEQRAIVEARHHVSSVFGLLSMLGGETVGALVIMSAGQSLNPGYIDTSWATILDARDKLGEDENASRALGNTISGAQHKVLLYLDGATDTPRLPRGAALTTHILKPDITHTRAKVWASAINETLIMRAAERCGLGVANVRYINEAKSCLVERFDRQSNDGTNWQRFHQADLCQLLGIKSDTKYERDGGPSFAQCYHLVKQKSSNPAQDCMRLLRWLFFNLYVGNYDSHAKNLSLLYRDGEVRLSPFYDLMCTAIYPGLSRNFAMTVGGEYAPGKMGAHSLELLAQAVDVNQRRLKTMALDLAVEVAAAVEGAAHELSAQTGPTEQAAIGRIVQWVASNTGKLVSRFGQG